MSQKILNVMGICHTPTIRLENHFNIGCGVCESIGGQVDRCTDDGVIDLMQIFSTFHLQCWSAVIISHVAAYLQVGQAGGPGSQTKQPCFSSSITGSTHTLSSYMQKILYSSVLPRLSQSHETYNISAVQHSLHPSLTIKY